jgi:imidazolonepropionase-like amidohydrolase
MRRSLLLLLPLLSLSALAESPTVEEPVGPTHSVAFTVDEGTWMNLDVSPEGDRVVFDLLGHLYWMPIEGGPAEALTFGHSWNQHPRFSPDGSRIAFTSDRGGGDNIWVLDLDTGSLSQITDESFRLVAQPDWTADGWIYARKHFTGTRSLGTGEIWAWNPDSPGDGVQWTEKGHLEADVNEPHVGPAGQFLYTVERGPFHYDPDPYSGIYGVNRTDLRTGETKWLAGGFGGAIRPQVSPDGRLLGYLRRTPDGQRTSWVVRDLESGAERVVWDQLDRDQQETWAHFGTYPTWSWTPDGGAVFFAQAGLWQVDLDGTAHRIPFQADVERELVSAVRQPHDPAPETFTANVIRWPRADADGDWVFQAVGRVYTQAPGGAPVQLSSDDVLAYAPAWSGESVVYVTWQDDAAGSLVLHTPGQDAQTLLDGDLFMSPSVSADGSRVVFLQGDGRVNRGDKADWWMRVRWMDLASGQVFDAGHVGRMGMGVQTPRPQFSPDGSRILFTDEDGDDTVLVSVDLQGHDRVVLAKGAQAAEIVPSPDGSWIAWKTQHQVYVAEWPATAGRAFDLDSPGAPSVRLSGFLGEWVSWSDDHTVTYAAGNDVYTVDLSTGLPTRVTSELEPTRKDPWPDNTHRFVGEHQQLQVQVTRDVHDQTLALVGGQVIPITGDTVIPQGVVVIRGEEIVSVGAVGQVDVPADATVIDTTGKTVFPGLIDVHAHMGYGWADVSPELVPAYAANLAYGVTTSHDPSANTHFVFSQRELREAGRIVGPRIFSTGFILYGAESDEKAVIESLDDAREHLRRIGAYGGISVKSYNQPRREQRQWVIQAAREEDMMVMPEGGSTLAHNLTMILDGHTGIEHALPVEQLADDVKQLWAAATDVFYTPTLLVGYGGVMGEHAFYQRYDVWTLPRLQKWTQPGRLEARGKRRPLMVPEEDWQHVKLAQTAAELSRESGVRVNMGAHGQLQGLGPHWEMWGLADGGWTPLEMLTTATLNSAAYLGMDEHLGSLEPGKLADVVIVNGDPLADHTATADVAWVIQGGVVYDPDTLAVEFPVAQDGPYVWWHESQLPGVPWAGDQGDGCLHQH